MHPRFSLPLAGLLCGLAGWSLRGFAGNGAPAPQSVAAAPAADSEARTAFPSSRPDRGSLAARIAESRGIEAMRSTDPSDMLAMLEAIGAMTRMSDGEARQAWHELSGQTPYPGFGNSLGVVYLLSRITRMGA